LKHFIYTTNNSGFCTNAVWCYRRKVHPVLVNVAIRPTLCAGDVEGLPITSRSLNVPNAVIPQLNCVHVSLFFKFLLV